MPHSPTITADPEVSWWLAALSCADICKENSDTLTDSWARLMLKIQNSTQYFRSILDICFCTSSSTKDEAQLYGSVNCSSSNLSCSFEMTSSRCVFTSSKVSAFPFKSNPCSFLSLPGWYAQYFEIVTYIRVYQVT